MNPLILLAEFSFQGSIYYIACKKYKPILFSICKFIGFGVYNKPVDETYNSPKVIVLEPRNFEIKTKTPQDAFYT